MGVGNCLRLYHRIAIDWNLFLSHDERMECFGVAPSAQASRTLCHQHFMLFVLPLRDGSPPSAFFHGRNHCGVAADTMHLYPDYHLLEDQHAFCWSRWHHRCFGCLCRHLWFQPRLVAMWCYPVGRFGHDEPNAVAPAYFMASAGWRPDRCDLWVCRNHFEVISSRKKKNE